MLVSELITDVRREILEVTGNFWSDIELIRLINRGLNHYSGEVRLGESTAFLSTTDGEAEYTLPANALSVKIVMYKTTSNGVDFWKRLDASTIEEISRVSPQFIDNSTVRLSDPVLYAVWDRKIRLEPIPKDSVASNLFIYFKSRLQNVINPEDSIPLDETLTESIQEYVLWKAWKKEKELDFAKEAREEYKEGIRRGRRYVKKIAEASRHRLDIPSNISFSSLGGNQFNPLNQ